jgi:hypothetical protein
MPISPKLFDMAKDTEQPATSKTVVLKAASTSISGMRATVRIRHGFALSHLLTAARFSRSVEEIEKQNAGQPFGPFYDDMKGFATACVLCSVAAVEAYLNELIADRHQHFKSVPQSVVDTLWKLLESKPLLDKFDAARTLLNLPRIDRRKRPGKDMDTLISLRNALTHFKPEWNDEQRKHAELSKQLKGHFKGNSYFGNEALFPSAWISHEATKWAIETVKSFIAAFEADAKITLNWDWGDSRLKS